MDAELKMHHFNHEYDDLQRQARTSVKSKKRTRFEKAYKSAFRQYHRTPGGEEMRHFS
jgi:hypothetical protein